jgi:hypothetical protein
MFRFRLSGAVLLLAAVAAGAVEPHTGHTFRLAEGERPPAATLDDARWLVGAWRGDAFGQTFEATWNPPSAGSMVGLFKLYEGEAVAFYEILLLTVEDGTLVLKVKHFDPDFSAWEEKADFTAFRLVARTPDALHFGGLSFYRRGDDAIDGYIVMQNGEEIREQHLDYRRFEMPGFARD